MDAGSTGKGGCSHCSPQTCPTSDIFIFLAGKRSSSWSYSL
ncbi:hypothetical protein MC885_018362 [Smutsia gigantea]|nr:hypothetical protein MC885_018362 [Smutsia gigantea]